MKKLFILGFSAALLTGGISSCAKTSKGKMANEWTVSSYDWNLKSTNNDGDVSINDEVLNGTTLNEEYTSTPNGGSASVSKSSSEVKAWTYTIEKDGTWKSSKSTSKTGLDSTFNSSTFEYDTFTVTVDEVVEITGVWNFIGKNKTEDFKKNERVLFSVLTEDYMTTSTVQGQSPVVSNDKYTYTSGDETMIYTVVESKGKELQLTGGYDYKNVDEYGTYTSVVTTNLTLSQE